MRYRNPVEQTQWINFNAREGHSINIFKHWKYTIEFFCKGEYSRILQKSNGCEV